MRIDDYKSINAKERRGDMTDSEMLRKLIELSGYKLKYVAECLGLSPYGLQLKINNSNEFKTSEVEALCELLSIKSLEEKDAIFFKRIDDLKSSKTTETDSGGGQ